MRKAVIGMYSEWIIFELHIPQSAHSAIYTISLRNDHTFVDVIIPTNLELYNYINNIILPHTGKKVCLQPL